MASSSSSCKAFVTTFADLDEVRRAAQVCQQMVPLWTFEQRLNALLRTVHQAHPTLLDPASGPVGEGAPTEAVWAVCYTAALDGGVHPDNAIVVGMAMQAAVVARRGEAKYQTQYYQQVHFQMDKLVVACANHQSVKCRAPLQLLVNCVQGCGRRYCSETCRDEDAAQHLEEHCQLNRTEACQILAKLGWK